MMQVSALCHHIEQRHLIIRYINYIHTYDKVNTSEFQFAEHTILAVHTPYCQPAVAMIH